MNNSAALIEENRFLWSLKTPYHVVSDFYNTSAFLRGDSTLSALEVAQVGNVQDQMLLHLQCHFGLDTLSWVRLGARGTGLDFSREAIQEAVKLARTASIDCTFRCADVLERQLDWESKFDRVVTSFGVICWLPNLVEWGKNIEYYLRPGGQFSLLEFHPLTNLFSPDVAPTGRYSNAHAPTSRTRNGTYANRAAPIQYTEHVWGHSIGEIVSALLDAGLTLKTLTEQTTSPVPFHPDMVSTSDGWTLEHAEERLPVLLSLIAEKPLA